MWALVKRSNVEAARANAGRNERLVVPIVEADIVRPWPARTQRLAEAIGDVVFEFRFQAGKLRLDAMRFDLQPTEPQPGRPQGTFAS